MSNSSFIKLVDKLYFVVESIGYDKTDQLLNNAVIADIKVDNDDVQKILEIISVRFEIPIQEIIYGTGRKNERKFAIGFCSYYMFYHIKLSFEQIEQYLKSSRKLCHKYSKMVTELNDRHRNDQKYCIWKKEFDLLFPKK